MPEEVNIKKREQRCIVASELEDKPSLDKIMDSKKKDVIINPPAILSNRRRRSTNARTSVKQKEPEVVARRNARERRRVKLVNDGFLRLRKHVPTDPKNKKLSKVKTLRSAIEYIRHLQQLLNQATKNTNIPLTEVLQSATINGSQTWFPSLDLVSWDKFLFCSYQALNRSCSFFVFMKLQPYRHAGVRDCCDIPISFIYHCVFL